MGGHCWCSVVGQASDEVEENGVDNSPGLEAGLGGEEDRSPVFADGHMPGQLG